MDNQPHKMKMLWSWRNALSDSSTEALHGLMGTEIQWLQDQVTAVLGQVARTRPALAAAILYDIGIDLLRGRLFRRVLVHARAVGHARSYPAAFALTLAIFLRGAYISILLLLSVLALPYASSGIPGLYIALNLMITIPGLYHHEVPWPQAIFYGVAFLWALALCIPTLEGGFPLRSVDSLWKAAAIVGGATVVAGCIYWLVAACYAAGVGIRKRDAIFRDGPSFFRDATETSTWRANLRIAGFIVPGIAGIIASALFDPIGDWLSEGLNAVGFVGPAVVCLVGAWAAWRLFRRLVRWLERRAFDIPDEPQGWMKLISEVSRKAQAAELRKITAERLGLTPREFLELLETLAGRIDVGRDPVATEYWSLYARVEYGVSHAGDAPARRSSRRLLGAKGDEDG